MRSLKSVSNKELLNQLKKRVKGEKRLTPELLARISDKSRKEVEAIIAEFQPVPLTPDKTQTVVVEQVVRPPEAATLDGDSDEC